MLFITIMSSNAIATKNFYKIHFSFICSPEVLILFCLALFVFQNCQALSCTYGNHHGTVLGK